MKFFIFILLLLAHSDAHAEIAVIANIDSDLIVMTKQQAEEVFMGRSRMLENVGVVIPLDQVELRAEFYEKLTGRPIEQINAYWARMLFSGQASPPLKLPDDITVMKIVNKNQNAVGYIDLKNVDKKMVRILFLLN